jgi:hypothetical protein
MLIRIAVMVTLIAACASGLANYDRSPSRPPNLQEERIEHLGCNFATSRRDMLAVSSIALTATMSQSAKAVDLQGFNVSKFGSGTINKQRIGGLAKKIQNSCKIMV